MVPGPSLSRAAAGALAGTLLGLAGLAGPAPIAHAGPTPDGSGAGSVHAGDLPDGAANTGRAAGPSRSGERRAPRTRAAAADDDPLRITIDTLAPGVLPEKGPLSVSGTITNRDLVAWQNVNLYPYLNTDDCRSDATCAGPMTSAEELTAAAASDPADPVGERITDLSIVESLPRLGPGETSTFTIRVPQRVLRAELAAPTPGIYWFGVHASGESTTTPRDDFADGRARTFLPYLPAAYVASASVDTAVVAPLRAPITHAADGSLNRIRRWERLLSVDGKLGGMLAFGAEAGPRPVTWLVDPAIPDAARALAEGNPTRQLTTTPEAEPTDGEGTDSTDGTDGAPTSEGGEGEPEASATPAVASAQPWLEQARGAFASQEVLSLPYGDPDISGAADTDSDLYTRARNHPASVLADWRITTSPAVAGPGGYVRPAAINDVSDAAVLLLGDRMFGSGAFPDGAPGTGEIGDRAVAVTSSGTAVGGPGPNRRLAPIALRQRLLSEAALRLVAAGDQSVADPEQPDPLVVVLPSVIDAAGATQFWNGLDVSWLHLTTVGAIVAGDREPISLDDLRYPNHQATQENPGSVFGFARLLTRAGATLQNVLGEESEIASEVSAEALTGTSFELRGDPRAASRLASSRATLVGELQSITISAPPGVTLSSSSGSFSVTVNNDLEVPVTVQVIADSDAGARVDTSQPIEVSAESRTSVSLEAHTSTPGVHNIRLELTDLKGNSLGSFDVVPVRSGQVSVVIWVIIGAGAAILFTAIAIRLFRRVRRARAARIHRADQPTDQPTDQPGDQPSDQPTEATDPTEQTSRGSGTT
ncbi:hypothetical protein E8D34_00305 [Nocardioides sp. GY 10113]|uniref:DUF6049 family protein n=1 Tax=Nocardioides sp. GY 10113 TaxID=2569761 RepID=UPI0010A85D86|nr:DUF6049 family protein [Nocardioides sp. GY 10113]TIC89003.1 hypothetical protein E8D34_00305 [Nocardioides sp. GY 10113]